MGGPRKGAAEQLNEAMRAQRAQLRATILGDETVDDITKAELLAQAGDPTLAAEMGLPSQNPNNTGAIQAKYEQAKAGAGIFGVRRLNQEKARLLLEKPGKRQTVLSQGPSSNNATSGLLTGINQ